MSRLRLALAQVNPTLGDLPGNAELVLRWSGAAARAGADLVAFPEMVLTGYPVEDLALRSSFVDASRATTTKLAADLAGAGLGAMPVVLGYLDRVDPTSDAPGATRPGVPKGRPQNVAGVLHGGRVAARYAKHHLPNYGVFDEFRIFVPGSELTVVRTHGHDIALAICEDLWQDGGPVARTHVAGAGLLLVLNGSPYECGKGDVRRELVTRRAAEAGCTLAYVNLVGGQDDLVFDGDSIVVAADGTVLARAPQFEEHLLLVDLDLPDAVATPATGTGIARVHLNDRPGSGPGHPVAPTPAVVDSPVVAGNTGHDGGTGLGLSTGHDGSTEASDTSGGWSPATSAPGTVTPSLPLEAAVHRALVLGLSDYVRKNGFRSVVLGLSGGIDSALVASLAADAIGARNVVGVSLPSDYSSEHSRDDAADLAGRIGLDYRVVPIAPMVASFLAGVGAAGTTMSGVAEENLQSRVRGVILMGLANQEGHLTLTTGNKSELAVGYSTIYGDSVGGFAPLKDVPKTLVWRLAHWRNAEAERLGQVPPIPENSISKPPSAELRPDQTDQDTLPPYDLLDAVLEAYVGGALGRSELLADGFDQEVVDSVVTMVDRAEWKRRQSAPGPKISPIAFGRDRRLPITSRWREHES